MNAHEPKSEVSAFGHEWSLKRRDSHMHSTRRDCIFYFSMHRQLRAFVVSHSNLVSFFLEIFVGYRPTNAFKFTGDIARDFVRFDGIANIYFSKQKVSKMRLDLHCDHVTTPGQDQT